MITMEKAIAAYGANSLERFPSFSEEVQKKRVGTTFFADFLVAQAFLPTKPKALEDTWNRVWKAWKNNITYVVELCLCLNHLCWNAQDEEAICQWYAEKFHFCQNRIFSDGSEEEPLPEGCINFSAEEKKFAFGVLD